MEAENGSRSVNKTRDCGYETARLQRVMNDVVLYFVNGQFPPYRATLAAGRYTVTRHDTTARRGVLVNNFTSVELF